MPISVSYGFDDATPQLTRPQYFSPFTIFLKNVGHARLRLMAFECRLQVSRHFIQRAARILLASRRHAHNTHAISRPYWADISRHAEDFRLSHLIFFYSRRPYASSRLQLGNVRHHTLEQYLSYACATTIDMMLFYLLRVTSFSHHFSQPNYGIEALSQRYLCA